MIIEPEDFAESLQSWLSERERFNDRNPQGFAMTATGTGTTDLPNPIDRPLFEHTSNPPRQWTVTMRGIPRGAGEGGFYPAAYYTVQVATDGESHEYEVDAGGEMALSVWGMRVRVSVQWDRALGAFAIAYPQSLYLSAAIAEARSAGTARRTRFVAHAVVGNTTVSVPRGSRGMIIRTPLSVPTNIGAITWVAGGLDIDTVPAAAVAAAHDRGEYLSVPSAADALKVAIAAVNPGLVAAEFEIRP